MDGSNSKKREAQSIISTQPHPEAMTKQSKALSIPEAGDQAMGAREDNQSKLKAHMKAMHKKPQNHTLQVKKTHPDFNLQYQQTSIGTPNLKGISIVHQHQRSLLQPLGSLKACVVHSVALLCLRSHKTILRNYISICCKSIDYIPCPLKHHFLTKKL